VRELQSIGAKKIFREQISSVASRAQLEGAIDFCREGDMLVVCKLDRLARSVRDLVRIIDTLKAKDVGLRILNMNFDTASPTGKMMLTILGSIAEFEREIIDLLHNLLLRNSNLSGVPKTAVRPRKGLCKRSNARKAKRRDRESS
jgi:DNA invertase Pin-like site-specific DNA recombinase